MTSLIRWNPIRETRSLFDAFNEFDRFLTDRPMSASVTNWGLALDVAENDDAYTVQASIPGISPDNINVTFEDNVLTIEGETKSDEEKEETNYHIRERRYGRFSRTVRFPVQVNTEAIEAVHENGVLTLTVPKAEEVKPKKITVKVNGS